MKLYLAGPMRGYPEFNFPAFRAAAARLREQGHTVFSPAEKDIERHAGVDISKNNPRGEEKIATEQYGFDLRRALADDAEFICLHADGVALLPGWQQSKGATAERALALALSLEVIEL